MHLWVGGRDKLYGEHDAGQGRLVRERDDRLGVLRPKAQQAPGADAIAVQLPEGEPCPLGPLVGDVALCE